MSTTTLLETVGIPRSTASIHDSTLVIINAQNEYVSGLLKTTNIPQTRPAIANLLQKYRSAGTPQNIVHVVHEVPTGAPVFTPNTALAAEFEELTPQPGEKVIAKNFAS